MVVLVSRQLFRNRKLPLRVEHPIDRTTSHSFAEIDIVRFADAVPLGVVVYLGSICDGLSGVELEGDGNLVASGGKKKIFSTVSLCENRREHFTYFFGFSGLKERFVILTGLFSKESKQYSKGVLPGTGVTLGNSNKFLAEPLLARKAMIAVRVVKFILEC